MGEKKSTKSLLDRKNLRVPKNYFACYQLLPFTELYDNSKMMKSRQSEKGVLYVGNIIFPTKLITPLSGSSVSPRLVSNMQT